MHQEKQEHKYIMKGAMGPRPFSLLGCGVFWGSFYAASTSGRRNVSMYRENAASFDKGSDRPALLPKKKNHCSFYRGW